MRTLVVFLLAIVLFQSACVYSADENEADVGAGEVPADKSDDADVQVEVESDGDKKDEKKEDDEELPKTGEKDIEIERADRTVTAEVTMEISFGKEIIGNVTFGLFGKQCPKTAKNFLTLSNPQRSVKEGYKGSKIHRIVKGFAIQGGDFEKSDGSGGRSIYGKTFRDENFGINHFPFCLSMANAGPDSNGSQFFVPLIRTRWLDGKHVVFGQVSAGHTTVKKINSIRTNRFHRPYVTVWISDTWTKEVHDAEDIKSEL